MKENVVVLTIGAFVVLSLSAGVAQADTTYFDRANELLQEQKFDEALKGYEAFIRENPEHELVPAAKWAIAGIHFAVEKDYLRAALVYQNIIIKHANTRWEFFSRERLGMCYEEQGQWSEAAMVYVQALEKLAKPELSSLVPEWNDVFKGRLVLSYLATGDLDGVLRVYQESLQRDAAGPSAPNDLFSIAETRRQMDDLAGTAMDYAMVVDRYPFSEYARRVKSEHEELLSTFLDYDWKPYSILQSAVIASQSGRFAEASAGFDSVIEIKRGTGMDHAARFQKELMEFRRAGDAGVLRALLEAGSDRYPYGLGGIQTAQFYGIVETVSETEAALASDSSDIGAYSRLGSAYYRSQAYYPGIEIYKKAIEVAPDSAGLYNILGYCYTGIGAYDDAIAVFKSLTKLAPKDPNSYDCLAEAYYLKGDHANAIRFYEKSVSVDPGFTNPYYMLGKIHHELNRDGKAKGYLQKYIELDPDGVRAEVVQDLLHEITGD